MENEIKILLIPDGDRRWAKEHNVSIRQGYSKMMEKVVVAINELKKQNINSVYLSCCSVNNLSRPIEQVKAFLDEFLTLPDIIKLKVKVIPLGNLDALPLDYKEKYLSLKESTKNNNEFIVYYLLAWSMDDEIVRIYNKLIPKYKKITKEILFQNTDIKEEINLIIRAGKRKRLSSFVPINSPYSEIFFLDKYFPDLTSKDILDALDFYNQQKRTLGL